MNGKEKKIKLHLGCGSVIIPGYINIDIQKQRGVDIVCDIRKLPLADNSVDLIYSAHTLEHFGRNNWQTVLIHWYDKLKMGGLIRLAVPDFKAIAERYKLKGDIEEIMGLVVGGQKNRFDSHGTIFDYKYLKQGLKSAGFKKVKLYEWENTILNELKIDDFSQAYLPHMAKEDGALMSLNVEAIK